MTEFEIATELMKILSERAEGSESGLMLQPYIETYPGYVALKVMGDVVWDNGDECSHEPGGWTVETELAHAEGNIRDSIAAMTALVTPVEAWRSDG